MGRIYNRDFVVNKFHSLSKDRQNSIRKKYRNKCNKEYRYSINLYIMYVVFGILSIIGLVCITMGEIFLGAIIFTLNFIFMIIVIYFLNLSNISFYKFLKKLNFEENRW